MYCSDCEIIYINPLIIFLDEENKFPANYFKFYGVKILLWILGKFSIFQYVKQERVDAPKVKSLASTGVDRCAKTAAFYGLNCFNGAKSCNKTQPASTVYAYANRVVFVFFSLDK